MKVKVEVPIMDIAVLTRIAAYGTGENEPDLTPMLHEAIRDYILKHSSEIEAQAKKSERYSDAENLWLYVHSYKVENTARR